MPRPNVLKVDYQKINRKETNADGTVHTISDGHVRLPDVHSNGEVAATETEDESEDNLPCSWGLVKPSFCQRFRNPKVVLFCLCMAGAIQGMIVNGFVSVVISTIEKRFDLMSTESGIVASSYDVASVLCLIPVSYLGGMGCKPRWLGLGLLLMGSGSMLFAFPHFWTGLYEYDRSREHICYKHNNVTNSFCDDSSKTSLSSYKYVLIVAQLLHGAGASPLYTLGVTYLDENLKAKMTPVYVGVFYAMAIVGPAVGYVLGGELLKTYTDIGAMDRSTLEITPDSPKWVGAWWIGFLIVGTLAFLVAFPILGFPRSLPGSAKLRAQRVSEAYQGSDSASSKPGFGVGIKDIPASLKILITNPTFMFLNLAGASEGMLLSGFAAFTPKFIESQFSISAGWAAQLVGFAMIPAGGGGTFIGGYIVKKFDLKCAGIIRFCLCTSTVTLLLTTIFLIQCPNVQFVGVNTPYGYVNGSAEGVNLSSTCNRNCHCLRTRYDPVCGDKKMYFSACHAGCTRKAHSGSEVYHNCSCLAHLDPLESGLSNIAHGGKCKSDCNLLAVFLPIFACIILVTFITSMPALSATLRCVPERQRSFALGIQWILVRCLGTIPAPILFGALIDVTCQLWQRKCDGVNGSCYFYDNSKMGMYLMALAMVGKALSVIFFFLSWFLYKAPECAEQPVELGLDSITANGDSNDKGTDHKDC